MAVNNPYGIFWLSIWLLIFLNSLFSFLDFTCGMNLAAQQLEIDLAFSIENANRHINWYVCTADWNPFAQSHNQVRLFQCERMAEENKMGMSTKQMKHVAFSFSALSPFLVWITEHAVNDNACTSKLATMWTIHLKINVEQPVTCDQVQLASHFKHFSGCVGNKNLNKKLKWSLYRSLKLFDTGYERKTLICARGGVNIKQSIHVASQLATA